MRRWIWPLLGAGGIVLVVVALLAVVQRSLIYHPLRLDAAACADLADIHGFEAWTNADGQAIGYRSPPGLGDRRAPVAVLIAHGNAGCGLQRAEYAAPLRAAAADRAVSVYLLASGDPHRVAEPISWSARIRNASAREQDRRPRRNGVNEA